MPSGDQAPDRSSPAALVIRRAGPLPSSGIRQSSAWGSAGRVRAGEDRALRPLADVRVRSDRSRATARRRPRPCTPARRRRATSAGTTATWAGRDGSGIRAVGVHDPDVVVAGQGIAGTPRSGHRRPASTVRRPDRVAEIDVVASLDETRLPAAVGIHHPDLAVVRGDVGGLLEPRARDDVEPACGERSTRPSRPAEIVTGHRIAGRRQPAAMPAAGPSPRTTGPRRRARGSGHTSSRCRARSRPLPATRHRARRRPRARRVPLPATHTPAGTPPASFDRAGAPGSAARRKWPREQAARCRRCAWYGDCPVSLMIPALSARHDHVDASRRSTRRSSTAIHAHRR